MSQSETEPELIRQAIAGDRAALAQLLLIHYDGLSVFVSARITPELQALIRAEDVLQQTFIRAAKAIGSFQPHHAGSFRSWLKTIAENLLKDAGRRRCRERRVSGGGSPGEGGLRPTRGIHRSSDGKPGAGFIDQVAGDQTAPSRRARLAESLRRLQSALDRLPDDHREVIQRRYLRGESLDEIAVEIGCTKDAVRGICYRARKNLRASLGKSSLYFSD